MMPCHVWDQTENEKPPLAGPTTLKIVGCTPSALSSHENPGIKASVNIHASLFMTTSNKKLFVTHLPSLGYMSPLSQSNHSLYLDLATIYTIK